jgi:hypothetical protein
MGGWPADVRRTAGLSLPASEVNESHFGELDSMFLEDPSAETQNLIKDGDKRCIRGTLCRVADEYAVC